MKTITVRCKAAVNLDLAELTPLQGGLKELSEANFEKLSRVFSDTASPFRSSSGRVMA